MEEEILCVLSGETERDCKELREALGRHFHFLLQNSASVVGGRWNGLEVVDIMVLTFPGGQKFFFTSQVRSARRETEW